MVLTSPHDLAVVSNVGGKVLCWKYFPNPDNPIDILYPECPYEYHTDDNKSGWIIHGGAHTIVAVAEDCLTDGAYALAANLLDMKGDEKKLSGVNALRFDPKLIKGYSNYELEITSEFKLKSVEYQKSQFTFKTYVHSYEALPFSLLLAHRIYLPYKNNSVLSIDGKDEIMDNYEAESLHYYIERGNEIGLESEYGLTSIKSHIDTKYDTNCLQILLHKKLGFVLVDSMRYLYVTPGIPTKEMCPKLTVTFTPY